MRKIDAWSVLQRMYREISVLQRKSVLQIESCACFNETYERTIVCCVRFFGQSYVFCTVGVPSDEISTIESLHVQT